MTIPDLGQLWLKRSVHPVRYVYLFHSTNSTHTVYRKGAFDAYDTIFASDRTTLTRSAGRGALPARGQRAGRGRQCETRQRWRRVGQSCAC